MAIATTDIKLLESERMADTTDGGGRRTSRVIPDGLPGNIFPKVSRVDSVYGRVNLRKVYGAVQTATVDTYAGAHAVITDAPDNAQIHTTLFSTASEYDTRTAARDRIESYVASGPEARMVLLGRQLAGQAQIVAYQRLDETLPEVGQVYCLSTEPGGTVTAYQYFRVQTVEHETRTFSELLSGSTYVEFTRRVITIGTGVRLRHDFTGHAEATNNSGAARTTKLRTTTIVDAARYFGIKPLSISAAPADLTLQVSSIYSPIVPTTNRETPLANAQMGTAARIVPGGGTRVIETAAASWAVGQVFYTRRPIVPGSLTISGAGVTAVTDDQIGHLSNGTLAATVDYDSGYITRTGGTASAAGYTFSYRPAGVGLQTVHTRDLPVTIGNRGAVYVLAMNPVPAPRTTFIDYMALGKWYRLRDAGNGDLRGDDPAYGVGSIDFAAGTVVLTLGALPDVGSSILISYGSNFHCVSYSAGDVDVGGVCQTLFLGHDTLTPGSVTIGYRSGGSTITATVDPDGAVTGTGLAGEVNHATGIADLRYTATVPDMADGVTVGYTYKQATVTGQLVKQTTTTSFAASMSLGTAVEPGTLHGEIPYHFESGQPALLVVDDGAGLVVAKAPQKLVGSVDYLLETDQIVGTVNYATGDLSFTGGVSVRSQQYQPTLYVISGAGSGQPPAVSEPAQWVSVTSSAPGATGASCTLAWVDPGIAITPTVVSGAVKPFTGDARLRIELSKSTSRRIIPGSLLFEFAGKTVIDRNGTLYANVSNTTATGEVCGEIDYPSGVVYLSDAGFAGGASLALDVVSCATSQGVPSEYLIFFRTAGAPVRPGSFYAQVTTHEGELLSVTSDEAGHLTGTRVRGTIDHQTGVVRLEFGEAVTAAGHESQWWYDADAVVGGMIFKPQRVYPHTLTYNAVVLSNLPLNADILGLDPVRLPMDGRVPIYRPADVVVVHNTQDFALPDPAVAGATYHVGRNLLSEMWLVDQTGVKVSPSLYTVDPDLGAVTMANPLNLTGYAPPLIAKHRIEDLALLSDVQINGQLTLAAPLSRAYPADTSFVSSALLFGDMNARVTNLHDLQAAGAWSDIPGPGATSQFNDLDYPVEVTNNGAMTERWRINFITTTNFQVIGENLGVIASGSIGADCSPTNALTGHAYFTIRAAGWGSGWSAGNQLRFNTIGAAAPVWIARTVLPGATLAGDSFSLQMRGDVDAV